MNGAKRVRNESLGTNLIEILAKLRVMIDDGRGGNHITQMMAQEGDDPTPHNQEYLTGTVREVYDKFLGIAEAPGSKLSPEEAEAIQRFKDLDNPNTMKESAERMLANATPEQIASDEPLEWKWRASEENAIKQFRELIDKGMGDKVFEHRTADGESCKMTANEIYQELLQKEAVKEELLRLENDREMVAIRPEAKASINKILEHNRKALARLGDAEFTPQTEAELHEIAKRATDLRDAMNNTHIVGKPGVFTEQVAELDRQVDQIASLIREPFVGYENTGAGKIRVLEEHRVARDRHSQIRQLPLAKQLGQKIGELNGLTHEEAHNMNVDSAHMIKALTGKPVIKAVEEIMDEAFPDLMKAFYPRVYENVGRFNSPRSCAAMMANVIAESLRYGYHRSATAYKLLMPGLAYLKERRMPMFFIAPDLMEAVQRTDFDDDINWTELELPYETGVFILPKGTLVHPEDGEIGMLIWSRVKQGEHGAPWPGLPSSILPNDAFVILGAALDRMVWYDSILTANVRPTTRLNNLFYRAPGEPQPSVTKSNFMDADLNEKDSEFLEKMGVIVFGTLLVMNDRPKLVERGQMIKRVGKGDKVREFWSPNIIGAKYKFKREVPKIIGGKFVHTHREGGTHASPRLHWRRGHHRNQPVGPGRKERKRIWIEPCVIGAD